MQDYIRNKQGKIKPMLDKNIGFYFGLTPETISRYKNHNTAKYLELKNEFKEAWRTGKIS